jgi:hypothetical protein
MSRRQRLAGTVRGRLADLPGVGRVLVDEDSGELWLACKSGYDPGTLERLARETLEQHGADPRQLELVGLPVPADAARPRVRFIDLESRAETEGRVSVTVTLEWRGQRASGECTGERGAMPELRTGAAATLRALEQLQATPAQAQLIGAKPLRAFDEDILVVSISLPTHRRLVGAVLVSGNPLRAVALAVLDALNRILGHVPQAADRG